MWADYFDRLQLRESIAPPDRSPVTEFETCGLERAREIAESVAPSLQTSTSPERALWAVSSICRGLAVHPRVASEILFNVAKRGMPQIQPVESHPNFLGENRPMPPNQPHPSTRSSWVKGIGPNAERGVEIITNHGGGITPLFPGPGFTGFTLERLQEMCVLSTQGKDYANTAPGSLVTHEMRNPVASKVDEWGAKIRHYVSGKTGAEFTSEELLRAVNAEDRPQDHSVLVRLMRGLGFSKKQVSREGERVRRFVREQ
jgi:hypothetical protein